MIKVALREVQYSKRIKYWLILIILIIVTTNISNTLRRITRKNEHSQTWKNHFEIVLLLKKKKKIDANGILIFVLQMKFSFSAALV